MKRNRKIYSILIIFTIALGLLSRTSIIPTIIYPYLGDYLYTILWFFIIGFLFPEMKSFKVAIISIITSYTIELLQFYQADWINYIRSYKLGGLILGYSFLWSDIVSYTFGGMTGWILERLFYQKTSKDNIL
ncbi:MAG: hypothetical protein ACI94Y_003199 [Maribacter sp.]|jgi:hypothetical protein